jgi:hypothetical protein
MAPWQPFRAIWHRIAALRWTRRGCRLLGRGDLRGAIDALERALKARPDAFGALLHLSRAYLRARDLFRAHRTLARAREANPVRFVAEAPRWVAREGFDVESVCSGFGAPRSPEPEPAFSAPDRPRGRRRRAASASLQFGDCRDLDEYARFRAMPPISAAEVEGLDWDHLLSDLLDE